MDFESPSPGSGDNANESRDETNMLCTYLTDALQKLKVIWNEIGITTAQRLERKDVVFEHLREMLDEMVSEEMQLKIHLMKSVDSCRKALDMLTEELGLQKHQPGEGLTILQLEKNLRVKVEEFSKVKHDRMKDYTDLRILEKEYCDRMVLPPLNIGSVIIPTPGHLRELEDNIKLLQDEQENRLATFSKLRKSVISFWEGLEMKPSAPVEKELIEENCLQTFELSIDNLEALTLLQSQLEKRQDANFTLASMLRSEITSLCQKLEIEEEEKNTFLSRCVGFKPSVIKLLEHEKDRLQKLKMENIQKFIDGLRRELETLWDKCFYADHQRHEFTPAFDEHYTEELLATHEHQVEIMKGYYEDNKDMFKLIEKRNVMWKKLQEIEQKASDPNRFSNRGGNLLKEEKEKKVLQKAYPKIEKELKQLIQSWEEEQERPFLINGVKYVDFIENQKLQCQQKKEEEKILRQKAKDQLMREEMVFGSKPSTPVKRKFITTPNMTPNKSRRVNDTTCTPSKFLQSSSHIFLSPAKSALKSAARSAVKSATKSVTKPGAKSSAPGKPPCPRIVSKHGKAKTPNRRRSSRIGAKRRVLVEKNEQACGSGEIRESELPQQHCSKPRPLNSSLRRNVRATSTHVVKHLFAI